MRSLEGTDKRLAVHLEAGVELGWDKYVGPKGVAIGLSRFGASAPWQVVYEKFGLTARHMADEAQRLLQETKK